MNVKEFKRRFKLINGFRLDDDHIIFKKPLELWNTRTQTSIRFNSVDDLLHYSLNGKMIKEHIKELNEFDLSLY